MSSFKLLIDGALVDGDLTMDVLNPATEEVVAKCARASCEQLDPILPVIKYSDPEDALCRANASPYGLGGSVWSSNPEHAYKMADRMESGISVECCEEGLAEFTQLQVVTLSRDLLGGAL